MATTEITHSAETGLETGLGERVQRVFAVSAARVAADLPAELEPKIRRHALWWPVDVAPADLAAALIPMHDTPLGLLADNLTLRDIGLTQNDVRAALSGRLAEDPSPQLQLLSSERRAALRAQRREAHLREQFTPRQG